MVGLVDFKFHLKPHILANTSIFRLYDVSITRRNETELQIALFSNLNQLVPYSFGNKLCPAPIPQKLLLDDLIDFIAKLDGQFHINIAFGHVQGVSGSFYVFDGSHMKHRCYEMETKILDWQKRVNRKFKVLGIVVAVFGLALIVFGFGAFMPPQILLSAAGVGLIVLGGYLFIDEFRILDEGETA